MDRSCLVSIGILCYNSEETFARGILSALDQDWEALEVIVIDDASTDGSWKEIERCAESDARIRARRLSRNLGIGGARNEVIDEAKGEFVCFFDDDDDSLPSRIRSQVHRIQEVEGELNTRLIACYAAARTIYANGYEFVRPAIGSSKEYPHGIIAVDWLLRNKKVDGVCYGAGTPASSLLARKEVFSTCEGFDPELRRVEDTDFAIRLAKLGGWFVGTKEVLLNRNMTMGSDKSALVEHENIVRLIKNHEELFQSSREFRAALLWEEVRFGHFSNDHLHTLRSGLKMAVISPGKAIAKMAGPVAKRLVHETRMNRSRGRKFS
ncbi:MAG: glycosyltransferase [Verrucomicrobiota bacterium]